MASQFQPTTLIAMNAFDLPDNGRGNSTRVVCRCLNITEGEICNALENNEIGCLQDIRQYTGAGDGCTCCHDLLNEYLISHQRRMLFSLELVR